MYSKNKGYSFPVEVDSASADLSLSESGSLSYFFDFAKCKFLLRNVLNDICNCDI